MLNFSFTYNYLSNTVVLLSYNLQGYVMFAAKVRGESLVKKSGKTTDLNAIWFLT
jgi:hypothetical protein